MQNQVYIFIAFILNGFLIGIVFDCFRILRKSFKTPDIITYIEDIVFGIVTGLLLLFSIMKFNNGELRVYLFLGILIGLVLYLLIFSSIFIKISVTVISIIKKIFNYVITIPLKFIYKFFKKIFFKPIIFVCISFKKRIRMLKMPYNTFKNKIKLKGQKEASVDTTKIN